MAMQALPEDEKYADLENEDDDVSCETVQVSNKSASMTLVHEFVKAFEDKYPNMGVFARTILKDFAKNPLSDYCKQRVKDVTARLEWDDDKSDALCNAAIVAYGEEEEVDSSLRTKNVILQDFYNEYKSHHPKESKFATDHAEETLKDYAKNPTDCWYEDEIKTMTTKINWDDNKFKELRHAAIAEYNPTSKLNINVNVLSLPADMSDVSSNDSKVDGQSLQSDETMLSVGDTMEVDSSHASTMDCTTSS